MAEKVILTAQEIRRTLARITHQIIERNKTMDNLVLVGIHTRGVPLAERLAANIGSFKGIGIPVGVLDISPYRDDLPSGNSQPVVRATSIPAGVDDKNVVLVDDVLYTGRSIRAAMDALIELGRPKSIQLAVLVDRGHREIPIRADYVGKNIPSSRHEEIRVRLVETDGADQVAVVSLSENGSRRGELKKVG